MVSLNVPVGFQFNPTDKELVAYYLRNKVAAAAPLSHYTVPLFENFAESKPWEMWEKEPKLFSTDLYFFTKLKMASRWRVDRKVGLGTWSEGEASKLIYEHDDEKEEEEEVVEKVAIGRKRKLRYEEKGLEHNGGWFIDEYSLVDAAGRSCYDQFVICRLRKNDRSSSTKRKSSSSSGTTKKKSRVNDQLGQDCTSALTTTTSTFHDHHPQQLGQLGQDCTSTLTTCYHDDHPQQLGQDSTSTQLSAPLVDDDLRFMADIGISLDDLDCFDYNSALMSCDPVVDVDQELQTLSTYDNNQMVVFGDQSLTSTTTYGAAGMADGQAVLAGGYSSNQYQALDDMIINSCSNDSWSDSLLNELLMP